MISVIVPIYNVQNYIEKCLKSISNQTYKNIEIILVNDASTDNSLKICKKIQEQDARIKIIDLKINKGVSNARNVGLENAIGKYICFIDSDDYIEKDMIENMVKNIEKTDSDISICNFKKNIKEKNNSNYLETYNKEELLKKIMGRKFFQGFVWNKLYKRDIIEKYGLNFKEDIFICEDLLFNCEYISKINKGVFDGKKLYNYVQRKDSAYNGEFKESWMSILKAYKYIYYIYKKNKLENYKWLKYNYLVANLDLKEKLLNYSKYNDEIIKKNIEENINKNLYDVLSNNEININEKIKLLCKAKIMNIFICLKKLKGKK